MPDRRLTDLVGDDGRYIQTMVANTEKDGSGTPLVPVTNEDGQFEVDSQPTVLTALTPDGADVGTESTIVMAANANRKYASFVNNSGATIYLGKGTAAVVDKGPPLQAYGGVETITKENLFLGAVYAIHAGTGTKRLCTEEGV